MDIIHSLLETRDAQHIAESGPRQVNPSLNAEQARFSCEYTENVSRAHNFSWCEEDPG